MIRVLLTRSLKENIEIISNYDDMFTFVNCPLIKYEDFKSRIKAILTENDNFIITSKHAAKIVAKAIIESKKQVQLWVVGRLSAQILKDAGGVIKFIAESANDLINNIPLNEYERMIYLSGSVVTVDFPEKIKKIIIYRIKYRLTLTTSEINQIKHGLNYILVFSENSAKILVKLLIKYDLMQSAINSTIILISPKIEEFIRLYFKNILSCTEGQYDQMLKILMQDAISK